MEEKPTRQFYVNGKFIPGGIPINDSDDVWTPDFIAFCANRWGVSSHSPSSSMQGPPSGSKRPRTIVGQPGNGPKSSGVPQQQAEEPQSSSTQSIKVPPLSFTLPSAQDLATDCGISALGSSSPLQSSSILDMIPLSPHGLSTSSSLPSIFDYMSALASASPVESSSVSDIIESAQPH